MPWYRHCERAVLCRRAVWLAVGKAVAGPEPFATPALTTFEVSQYRKFKKSFVRRRSFLLGGGAAMGLLTGVPSPALPFQVKKAS